MKKTTLIVVAILFTISASADRRTIKDRSENWLQHETSEETSGDLRTSRGLEEVPDAADDPRFKSTPIPDAWPFIVLMAAGYGFVLTRKKQRDSQK